MTSHAASPHVRLITRSQLRDWLAEHHASHPPIWLEFPKKHTRRQREGDDAQHLTYDVIVEECLCFGWIDSLPGRVDDAFTKIYLAPRKPRSVWSALNKRRVEALIRAGLMTGAGLAKITLAKQNGSWDALAAVAQVDAGTLPADFAAALDAHAKAREHFAAFPPGVKRQVVQWIITAKQPATRAQRIRISVAMAKLNQRASDPAQRRAFLTAHPAFAAR